MKKLTRRGLLKWIGLGAVGAYLSYDNNPVPQSSIVAAIQLPVEQVPSIAENKEEPIKDKYNLDWVVDPGSEACGWTPEEAAELNVKVQHYAALIREYVGVPPWRDGDVVPVKKFCDSIDGIYCIRTSKGGYNAKLTIPPYGEISICGSDTLTEEWKQRVLYYTLNYALPQGMLSSLELPSHPPFFPDSINTDDKHFAFIMATYFFKITHPDTERYLDEKVATLFAKDKYFIRRLYQKCYDAYDNREDFFPPSQAQWWSWAREVSKTPEFYDWLEKSFLIKDIKITKNQ